LFHRVTKFCKKIIADWFCKKRHLYRTTFSCGAGALHIIIPVCKLFVTVFNIVRIASYFPSQI
jgi:hypothetical protein